MAFTKHVISRRNFIIVTGSASVCLLFVFIALALIGLFSSSGRVMQRHCFLVDMLETHVPNFEMPGPRQKGGYLYMEKPPVAFGSLCFDKQQLVVDWSIKQSYWRFYDLKDLSLRGPLIENDDDKEKVAPTVLALGLQAKHKHTLFGSTIIEKHLLERILEHHSSYYISLEGAPEHLDESSEGRRIREIGRNNLKHRLKH